MRVKFFGTLDDKVPPNEMISFNITSLCNIFDNIFIIKINYLQLSNISVDVPLDFRNVAELDAFPLPACAERWLYNRIIDY